MNSFFTRLIDRHLDRCNTIQPRTPGLFEPDHDSVASPFPDEPANPVEGDSAQPASFSPDSVTEKNRSPETVQSRETFVSPSRPAQESASDKYDFSHQQRPSSFSHGPQIDTLLNSGMQPHPIEPEIREKTAIPPQQNMAIHTDEPRKNRPLQSANRENTGSEFGHHIQTTVQRLTDEPDIKKTGHTETVQAGQGVSPQNSPFHSGLEPPSWLPEIEARFKHYLQEKNEQPEPVINVTIGRVEVRATQTEPPRQKPQPQKPAGVMTLDDYLKQREHGGRR